jgi:catechol 2,3-dioxygenase-like lactoylglutathione lyase family enzyme
MSAAPTTVHHIQVAMPPGGEEAAEDFYGRLLGLTSVAKPPHLQSRGGRWFACGAIEVHLGVEDAFSPARKAHPAFLVEDASDLRALLTRSGYEIVDDTQIEGFDRFYTADPFGNRIEFVSPVAPGVSPRRPA